MDTLKQINLQEWIEEGYSRKSIDRKIREEIKSNPETVSKLELGVQLISEWMEGDYFASKNNRIEQIKDLNKEQLVMDIFTGIAYCQRAELFTSVTAQMASRLGMSDKREAIATVAEMVAVLCNTDAFDIFKPSRNASLMIQSAIPLTDKLNEYIERSEYLPPMVCKPNELTHNSSGAYLTQADSLILGKGNHHDGDLCLDVLNLLNSVPLKLDTDFLSTVEEEPTFEITSQDQQDLWIEFKAQSYTFYKLMVDCGNEFYMTHKVDKRGRIYAQGYHISTMGASFKKASIEFADEEVITGVPY